MRSRERTAKSGTGLTIAHIAIGKEYTLRGREAIGNLASLAHEAVLQFHGVDDRRAVGYDSILTDDTSAYVHA